MRSLEQGRGGTLTPNPRGQRSGLKSHRRAAVRDYQQGINADEIKKKREGTDHIESTGIHRPHVRASQKT